MWFFRKVLQKKLGYYEMYWFNSYLYINKVFRCGRVYFVLLWGIFFVISLLEIIIGFI